MVEWIKRNKIAVAIAVVAIVVAGFLYAGRASAADKGSQGKIAAPESPLANFLPKEITKATGWTGAYVGVGGGYQVSDTEESVPGLSSMDGFSGRGWAGDARLGFDWQPSGTPIVFGVLGGYNIGEAEFNAFNGPVSWSATLEPTWYVGGRLGVALPTKMLLYGGAAWQEVKRIATFTGLPSESATEQGIMYIAGIEQVITPTLTLGAEYSLARYEFQLGDVSLDPDVHAFKVRLNWRPFSN